MDTETTYDPAVVERATEVGDALQHAVAARPDLAVSIVGVALDALSSSMRHSPSVIVDNAGFLTLAVAIYNYVVTGEGRDAVVSGIASFAGEAAP